MAHIHAKNMKLYAEDASNHDEPWKLWEYDNCSGYWACYSHPTWSEETQYRRKLKFIDINGHKILEPLRIKPIIGEEYYYPNIEYNEGYYGYHEWINDKTDNFLFENGLCHATKEAAIDHTKALLSITKLS